jgi:hypothetical protein
MRRIILIALLLCSFVVVATPHTASAASLSAPCAWLHSGAGNAVGVGAGATNGYIGNLNAGETGTLTVTLNTATAATFTINYQGNPAAVLVGPANAPGTLRYTYGGGAQPGGLGWYIQSATGGTVNVTMDCNVGGQGWEGPGIPAGFVLKTIVCDVAAVQSPGGPVVPNIKPLVPGATWFMNPKAVKDAQGKLWTEVFLGGYNNAFIPANCAQ